MDDDDDDDDDDDSDDDDDDIDHAFHMRIVLHHLMYLDTYRCTH